MDREFCICSISDEIFEKIYGKSFKEDCTVPRENLRLVKVLHKNLEGQTLQGELICSEKIDGILLKIFRELYLEGYPIEKIRLVDEYEADDEKSMADNNSSCFNFRFISFTKKISKHGAGLAVDINPLYNPYIKKVGDRVNVEPANALPYTDRTADFPYKIRKGDSAYRLFTENGLSGEGTGRR